MSEKFLRKTIPQVRKAFEPEKAERIIANTRKYFDEYCSRYSDECKELKQHTHGQIYPILSYQRAFEDEGFTREEATRWLTDAMAERCNELAPKLQKIMAFCNIWKRVPWIFSHIVPKMFGPKAGFKAEYLITDRDRSKFDMKVCPYATIFTREGYPELCRICCMSDDLTYGVLSPEHLGWGRTKTIGRGDDVCDFDIFYLKK